MLFEAGLVALGATAVAAVQSLEVSGNQFINPKTGNVFQIVGMAYQPGGAAAYDPQHEKDPLSNKEICLRDAALMQTLGVNTIRVYNLDPTLNHDECASIFNAAGMYMLIDVNSPLAGESISDTKPWESYYTAYLERTFKVVEAFKNYPNTLGFFSGNEVISSVKAGAFVPPIIRAVTRDLKQYVKNHADRPIPVGYSAADVRDVLEDSWNYFQCALDGDEDDLSRVDMFALNSYSWCGESSFTISGYDQLVAMFKETSVPVFFSEFGCNNPQPRLFTEIESIYGTDMTGTFSGGVVYEYTQEKNDYGLAEINNDDQSLALLDDFNVLKEEYAKVDFTSVQSTKARGSSPKPPTCKSSLIKEDGFNNNFTIPAAPPGAPKVIKDGVSPKPSGKIVDISDWKVTYEVTNPDGSSITNLAVVPLDGDAVNTPGSNEGGTQTGGSGNSSSTDTPNAAVRAGPAGAISAAAYIIPAILALSMGAGFRLI